jgi:hypothetical protein
MNMGTDDLESGACSCLGYEPVVHLCQSDTEYCTGMLIIILLCPSVFQSEIGARLVPVS